MKVAAVLAMFILPLALFAGTIWAGIAYVVPRLMEMGAPEWVAYIVSLGAGIWLGGVTAWLFFVVMMGFVQHLLNLPEGVDN